MALFLCSVVVLVLFIAEKLMWLVCPDVIWSLFMGLKALWHGRPLWVTRLLSALFEPIGWTAIFLIFWILTVLVFGRPVSVLKNYYREGKGGFRTGFWLWWNEWSSTVCLPRFRRAFKLCCVLFLIGLVGCWLYTGFYILSLCLRDLPSGLKDALHILDQTVKYPVWLPLIFTFVVLGMFANLADGAKLMKQIPQEEAEDQKEEETTGEPIEEEPAAEEAEEEVQVSLRPHERRRRINEWVNRILECREYYHSQFSVIYDQKGLFKKEGNMLPAESLPEEWLEEDRGRCMLEGMGVVGIKGLYTAPEESGKLTHQGAIVQSLLQGKDVLCCLPIGSGRTTAALLAVFHELVNEQRNCLIVCPDTPAVKNVYLKVRKFLESTGWERAVTLEVGERILDAGGYYIANVLVITAAQLHELLLSDSPSFRLFLEDVALVVLENIEQYYGTYGSHSSLVFRRLRRRLELYRADYRVFVTTAPYENYVEHARLFLGYDLTPDELEVIPWGDDARSRPERAIAYWTAPRRFTGKLADSAVISFSLQYGKWDEDFRELIACVSSALSRDRSGQNTIIVLSRGLRITQDDADARFREMAKDWNIHVVESLDELDSERFSYDNNIIVVAGYPGSWQMLMHEVSHFGKDGSLILIYNSTDPLSQYFTREASNERILMEGTEFSEPTRPWVSTTNQRGVIAPYNPSILSAHLLYACQEHELRQTEVRKYFGAEALAILRDKTGEEIALVNPVRTDGADLVFKAQKAPPKIDFRCVATGEGDLIPFIRSDEIVGHLERKCIAEQACLGRTRYWRRRRYLITGMQEFRNEVVLEGRLADRLEYREPISSLTVSLIEEPDKVHQGTKIYRTSERTGILIRQSFGRAEVTGKVYGVWQYDGFVTAQGKPQTLETPTKIKFNTHALFITLSLTNDKQPMLDFPTLHTIKHAIKVLLPTMLRYEPEELEIIIQREDTDRCPYIIFYDNHPEGTCYSSYLSSVSPEFWGHLLSMAYQLLALCPCDTGCWHCTYIPNCRCAIEDDGNWIHNSQLDKASAFDFLGRGLDEGGHRVNYTLKFGRLPDQKERVQ